jgi:hypothetical protein
MQKTALNVKEAYLLIRCLPMHVLLLRAFVYAGMCLPSRCLAMGIQVTIFCNPQAFVSNVFEGAKTVYDLDRAVTVIDYNLNPRQESDKDRISRLRWKDATK